MASANFQPPLSYFLEVKEENERNYSQIVADMLSDKTAAATLARACEIVHIIRSENAMACQQ
jgi:hypothetical protein